MTVRILTEQEGATIANNTELNLLARSGGVSVQNDDNQAIRIDEDGITIRNANGVILVRIDSTGFTYYNGLGNPVAAISSDGFDYYDADGNLRAQIGQNSAGQMAIRLYDSAGRCSIFVGQDPATSKPVLAVGKEGVDVEDELRS